MLYHDFLTKVIDKGIDGAKLDYAVNDSMTEEFKKLRQMKLHGSIAGFETCRRLEPQGLRELLSAANTATRYAVKHKSDNRPWYRCYEAEVEWVCNVISLFLKTTGHPTIITPTARAAVLMETILREEQNGTTDSEYAEDHPH